jgi:plastocyanin domain-containing protein
MAAKLIVTLAGIGLILFLNWYFFFSREGRKPPRS